MVGADADVAALLFVNDIREAALPAAQRERGGQLYAVALVQCLHQVKVPTAVPAMWCPPPCPLCRYVVHCVVLSRP